MEYRTLKVYFESSKNAEFNIQIDGAATEIERDYFQFQTRVDFYGSCSVSIKVTKGSVTLERCTATYPAIINDQPSQITMSQPIKSPVALVSSDEIQILDFPVKITDQLSYQHLMFNGPSYFIIDSKEEEYSNNLYIGNLLNRDINPSIKNIDTVYNYIPQSNDLLSNSDLEQLYSVVLNKFV